MSYAIFRSKAINTVMSLSQIGKHNKREKEAYLSNPDIRKHNTFLNIQVVPCNTSYAKRFNEITKDYQDEHNKRMETMRSDRKCTFTEHVNSAKNVVADELLFTSDKLFFNELSEEELNLWSEKTMEFIYNDLGYKKEQITPVYEHMKDLMKDYQMRVKEEDDLYKEIEYQQNQFEKMQEKYSSLRDFIIQILQSLKEIFKKILQLGSEKDKENVVHQITDLYKEKLYDEDDLYEMSSNTPKENEINSFLERELEYD